MVSQSIMNFNKLKCQSYSNLARLNVQFENDTLSRSQVFKRHKWFKNGREFNETKRCTMEYRTKV